MIDLKDIQEYYNQDRIVISRHALECARQRGIKLSEIKRCIFLGEIIEQYPEDFPFPSCLIFGCVTANKVLHVVVSDEGTAGRIITAYIPNTDKFESDLKTRKERQS